MWKLQNTKGNTYNVVYSAQSKWFLFLSIPSNIWMSKFTTLFLSIHIFLFNMYTYFKMHFLSELYQSTWKTTPLICHTLPGLWNLPVKRPWLCRSNGLSTFLMPNMFPRAIRLNVHGFWLFCSISAWALWKASRPSLLITWNNKKTKHFNVQKYWIIVCFSKFYSYKDLDTLKFLCNIYRIPLQIRNMIIVVVN